LLATALLFGVASAGASASDAIFPEVRPATRAQAAGFIAQREEPGAHACLTARMQSLRRSPQGGSSGLRRALTLLREGAWPTILEDSWTAPDGVRLRYTSAENALDRIAIDDLDGDGRPDMLAAVVLGIEQARALLAGRLGLQAPESVEVLLVDLGEGGDGYLLSADHGLEPARLVLEAAPAGGAEAGRRSAIHQYVHAMLALAGPVPLEWAEAAATWAVVAVDGRPDPRTARLLSRRLARLDAGLFVEDLDLAAGNALWFSFLEQAHGPSAVRVAIAELAAGAPAQAAFERALARVAGLELAAAFREFHLWSLLVGPRADRFHFPFAAELAGPRFVSAASGLPALSIQADPPVASWGAVQVRIDPEQAAGGLRIHFEGEFAGRFEADVLLIGRDGSKRRLPLRLVEGRGESVFPVDALSEVLLLVRHLASEDRTPRRYTYAVHGERGYPFELVALDLAAGGDGPDDGVAIVWETASEQDLIGFNVLRAREDGGRVVRINPVWIPALGDASNATSYRYLDRTAERGVRYVYRVEGITRDGLTSIPDASVHGPTRAGR
jgi:hypothetical protein